MQFPRAYIKGCHIYQLHRNEKPKQLQHRIIPIYKAMTRHSIDFKVMPRSYRGFIFILVVINEVANFMVTIPIHQSRSEEIGDALIDHVFSKCSVPKHMIRD